MIKTRKGAIVGTAGPAFQFDVADLPPLLRLQDIVRDRKRKRPGLVPIVRSAWLELVQAGVIPEPVKLGVNAIAWRREDVLHIIANGIPATPKGLRAKQRAAAKARAAAARTRANARTDAKPADGSSKPAPAP